jgi:PEP-CTERM motif
MKRAVLASVAGIAFSGLAAFGQGHIIFSNYGSAVYNPVEYGPWAPPGYFAGLANHNVDDPNVELQLFYAYGDLTSDSISAFLAFATPGVTTFINPALNPAGSYGTTATKGTPGGYYNGPDQVLTNWAPGETVTFLVRAWETAGPFGGPTFASSGVIAESSLWTETGAPPGQNGIQPLSEPPAYFADGPPLMFFLIPEPATLAFSGLGLLALLACACRKQG